MGPVLYGMRAYRSSHIVWGNNSRKKENNLMNKILLSSVVVVAAAAVVVGATTAFFSDTETSSGNVFTAGSIDLKVDSDCHYWNITSYNEITGEPVYTEVDCGTWDSENPEPSGSPVPVAVGQWSETDLGVIHRFFSFNDIKPGDKGEDTISLHVYDNDAWGRVLMGNMDSDDNDCTEPEGDEENAPGCDSDGELLGAMLPGFKMWLDQGSIPGFQCVDSTGVPVLSCPDFNEGDNVWQQEEGDKWNLSSELELADVLENAYGDGECDEEDNNDVPLYSADGHNNYGTCHGLADDGRMVCSTTYYLGLEWELPWSTGNEVQTDSLSGDLSFEVVQHRNNPNPW